MLFCLWLFSCLISMRWSKKKLKYFYPHKISKFIHLANIYWAPTEFSHWKAIEDTQRKGGDMGVLDPRRDGTTAPLNGDENCLPLLWHQTRRWSAGMSEAGTGAILSLTHQRWPLNTKPIWPYLPDFTLLRLYGYFAGPGNEELGIQPLLSEQEDPGRALWLRKGNHKSLMLGSYRTLTSPVTWFNGPKITGHFFFSTLSSLKFY